MKYRISTEFMLFPVIELEVDDDEGVIQFANRANQELKKAALREIDRAFKTARPTITQID